MSEEAGKEMEFKPVDFGFKHEQRVDLSDTYMAYTEKQDVYKEGQCYYNAFKVLDLSKKHNKNDKIVFGYVLSTDGKRKVAVRHAWNYVNDRIIDVTMIANDESPISMLHYRYLPIDEYELEEYRDLMLKNETYDLPLTSKEKRYIKKLEEKGFELPDYEKDDNKNLNERDAI